VRRADGSYGVVSGVETIHLVQRMYNITVDWAHTYYVGDQAWLVHNYCRVIGKPQVTDIYHAPKIRTETRRLVNLRDPNGGDLFQVIYRDKSLGVITNGRIKSRMRPDITAIDFNGNYHIVEVLSSSQTPSSMLRKINIMTGLLNSIGITASWSVIP